MGRFSRVAPDSYKTCITLSDKSVYLLSVSSILIPHKDVTCRTVYTCLDALGILAAHCNVQREAASVAVRGSQTVQKPHLYLSISLVH